MRWENLTPDPRMIAALDAADAERSRRDLIPTDEANAKGQWSNRFADACARMVAEEVRRHAFSDGMTVLPDATAEPPTVVYWDRGEKKRKKIDVVAGSLIAGLQLAISLKGVGFRDLKGLQFDKNITGRGYELENETRQLHEYRPQALVVALYYVPLGAVDDKRTDRKPSGFARIAEYLRAAAGRTDPNARESLHKLDMAFVGLYVPGDPERFWDVKKACEFSYDDHFDRGVVGYVDVMKPFPKRGRPPVDASMDLEGFVNAIADRYTGGPGAPRIPFSEPEPDLHRMATSTSPATWPISPAS
jgi:hypothetical protein